MLKNNLLYNSFLSTLSFIVVDEGHAYRGTFGAHVSMVLRRLDRCCRRNNSSRPQICFFSATVANPVEHFINLTGRLTPKLVNISGAPCGRRLLAIWARDASPDVAADRVDEIDDRVRGNSGIAAAGELLASCVRSGVRTILFCSCRSLVEIVGNNARRLLGHPLDSRCVTYRAGYPHAVRRSLEKQIFSGEALGVVSTNALELGIDVGGMDTAIVLGYPGSQAALWQELGRAGRRSEDSMGIVICMGQPLDTFFGEVDPESLFNRPAESICCRPFVANILGPHLLCAAKELPPLTVDDLENYFDNPQTKTTIEDLVSSMSLVDHGEGWRMSVTSREILSGWKKLLTSRPKSPPISPYHCMQTDPLTAALSVCGESQMLWTPEADDQLTGQWNLKDRANCLTSDVHTLINLRCAEVAKLKVIDLSDELPPPTGGFYDEGFEEKCLNRPVLDELELDRAIFQAHPGRAYINGGREYLIEHFDLERGLIGARRTRLTYYTKARDHTDLSISSTRMVRQTPEFQFGQGPVEVTSTVWGYRKFDKTSGLPIDTEMGLSLPAVSLSTDGLWLLPTQQTIDEVQAEWRTACIPETTRARWPWPNYLLGGLHAAAHALSNAIALVVVADPFQDVRPHCFSPYASRVVWKAATVVDGRRQGSTGATGAAFERLYEVVQYAYKIVNECSHCKTTLDPLGGGCPFCICHNNCGEMNQMVFRGSALVILRLAMVSLSRTHGTGK